MENNDSWVYYNGELYHAGVKGMSWGKHLPGTDWWKKTTQQYYQSNKIGAQKYKDVDEKGKVQFRTTYGNNVSTRDKIRANLNTAGQAAKDIYGYARAKASHVSRRLKNGYYGRQLKKTKLYKSASDFASKVSGKLSEFATNAWAEARNATRTYIAAAKGRRERLNVNSSMSFLDTIQNKQMEDAERSYTDGKVNGSVGNTINQFIQNAQYGIVKGINNYLKQMKLDDDVDRFLNKISGGKTRRSVTTYVKDNTVSKSAGPFNSNEQRSQQSYERNYETPEERQRRIQQNRVR